MRWRFWMRKDTAEADAAREARAEAEARLHDARHNVIDPLREMRRDNHVSARLDTIIIRAARHRGG